MKDLVTVIITTKNEESVLERLLLSVKAQTYKLIETIVVDNGSSDRTKTIAKKYTKKVFDYGPERSAQRNFGVKNSRGKYLLILDADMELSPNVVTECVNLMSNRKNVGAVVIPEKSVAKRFWEKVKAYERSFYNVEGDEVTDAARFFARYAFDKVEGYDESITGPEDWDLPESIKNAGFAIGRVKALIYHYERVPNPFKLAKKKFYYGLKAYKYMDKHRVSPVSAKTIYFMRPVFYKNWRRLLQNPGLTLAMFFMLTLEQIGGGIGYVTGRILK